MLIQLFDLKSAFVNFTFACIPTKVDECCVETRMCHVIRMTLLSKSYLSTVSSFSYHRDSPHSQCLVGQKWGCSPQSSWPLHPGSTLVYPSSEWLCCEGVAGSRPIANHLLSLQSRPLSASVTKQIWLVIPGFQKSLHVCLFCLCVDL